MFVVRKLADLYRFFAGSSPAPEKKDLEKGTHEPNPFTDCIQRLVDLEKEVKGYEQFFHDAHRQIVKLTRDMDLPIPCHPYLQAGEDQFGLLALPAHALEEIQKNAMVALGGPVINLCELYKTASSSKDDHTYSKPKLLCDYAQQIVSELGNVINKTLLQFELIEAGEYVLAGVVGGQYSQKAQEVTGRMAFHVIRGSFNSIAEILENTMSDLELTKKYLSERLQLKKSLDSDQAPEEPESLSVLEHRAFI